MVLFLYLLKFKIMNKYFPEETAKKFILDPNVTGKKIFHPKVGEVLIEEITPERAEELVKRGVNFIKPIDAKVDEAPKKGLDEPKVEQPKKGSEKP